jgi:hypothetical protein
MRVSSMCVTIRAILRYIEYRDRERFLPQLRLDDIRTIKAKGRQNMDLPLLIAIIALLAWTLLPQLDRYADSETGAERKRSYLSRLARWVNN